MHKIDNPDNLLLNLLVRETTNWYFLDIVPKHDDELAAYMRNIYGKGFLRFELSTFSSVIYFPIIYRSLVGMHFFGDCPAIRKDRSDMVVPISPQAAINLLLEQAFPKLGDNATNRLTDNIEKQYTEMVRTSISRLIPEIHNVKTETETEQQFIADSGGIPSEYFISEHGNSGGLSRLLQTITQFAAHKTTSADLAVLSWVKQYSIQLLATALDSYLITGIFISVCPQSTYLILDDTGFPDKVLTKPSTFVLHCDSLSESFNKELLEQLLLVQLLTHHLYPLIRSIGLLGLAQEDTLLTALSEAIDFFKDKFGDDLAFLSNVHTRATAFLPALLKSERELDFAHRRVHVHNHVININYYAPELIKPKPGEVVHKRYFNGGTCEIGIRAFDIDTDLKFLYEWVNQDYAKKFWEMDGPIRNLEEAYIKHLGVDYSHPYIGTLNGEPIFTLELYWAIKDEVGKYYPFHPGDYGFHMLIAPAKKRVPNFSYYALTMCMEHFFSFKQVHRMIGEASVEHLGTHNLITKVGCEFDKALVLPYKTSNLTFLTREMYHEAVKDVLDSSCTKILINI